ncbi:MAG: GNAT family N-acetyltransferase [Burkholderiales bacterium]
MTALGLVPVGDAATRAAAEALIREYLEFIQDSARQHYALEFDLEAMVESDLHDEGKFYPPRGRFYLVRHDGKHVGVGCLKTLASGVAEIQRMYLQPGTRGLGAGRLIVERLVADAREMGFERVRLESLKLLASAHALYRSVGFREIDPYTDSSMKDYQAAESMDRYRASVVFMELAL